MALPIEDYALIGDLQTAALVGRNGSIDWLCLPRFDSGACFAALLGGEEHGCWVVAPACEVRSVTRRYAGDTLVLETSFLCDEGEIRLIDFMPNRSNHADVVRIVVGVRGRVPMRMRLVVRFDYGWIVPWLRPDGERTWVEAGPDTVCLWTPLPVTLDAGRVLAEFVVSEGERIPFFLVWHPTTAPDLPVFDADGALDFTTRMWTDWSSRCQYTGAYREAVMRSLITLKALTYAPTGGMVAAPTTSLPERLGGVRNWDYRYCWIRDATFTLYALSLGGYAEEARSWRDWLLRAVAGDPRQLQIMYGAAGERRLTEHVLDWLPGYEGSAPVRVGNLAASQLQLDVYGEVMDAMHVALRSGVDADVRAWDLQRALTECLEEIWMRPDEGIWEVRGPQRHFTHSKVMAWVAVDRAVKGVERFGLSGPVERWKALRARIHEEVCARGFNASVGAFTQYYDSDRLDASVLMIPLVGFLKMSDPRVQSTVRAVERGLMRDGFVARYVTEEEVDGLPEGEGTFLPCSFWLVDNLALMGEHHRAVELFERLLSIRNDVGLLAEEYSPRLGRMLGNFPQAFTHVGLVNSAWNITKRMGPAQQRRKG